MLCGRFTWEKVGRRWRKEPDFPAFSHHFPAFPTFSQFCSAGYVLGGFFKESNRRGVEIAGKNEKDLSRELAAGKARPGEARD